MTHKRELHNIGQAKCCLTNRKLLQQFIHAHTVNDQLNIPNSFTFSSTKAQHNQPRFCPFSSVELRPRCHHNNEFFHHNHTHTLTLDRSHFSLLQLFQNIFLRLVRYTELTIQKESKITFNKGQE